MSQIDRRLRVCNYELQIAENLTRAGIYVSLPLLDCGADLIVTDKDHKKFIAVQVKGYKKESSIVLTRKAQNNYKDRNFILAFVVESGKGSGTYYISYSEWDRLAVDRKRADGKRYIKLGDKARVEKYRGDRGLKRAFRKLLPAGA